MAEVFAINGASPYNSYRGRFGQQLAPCPAGWAVTPNGNCGAPVANCPPAMQLGPKVCRSMKAMTLQNALQALGNFERDQTLAALKVDGLVGPKTTAAANHALVTYALKANVRFRTGNLSQAQVANEAALIGSIIGAEIERRGGSVPPVPVPRAVPAKVPGRAPVPIPGGGEEVSVMPTPRPTFGLWGLVGINAVLAVTGLYIAHIEYGGGRRAAMV